MDKNMEKLVLIIVSVFMVICVLATMAIPAVLACKYGWVWLLTYPAVLLFTAVITKRRKK